MTQQAGDTCRHTWHYHTLEHGFFECCNLIGQTEDFYSSYKFSDRGFIHIESPPRGYTSHVMFSC